MRTYLLSYGPYYNSLSLAALCDMFELEEKECYRLCRFFFQTPSPLFFIFFFNTMCCHKRREERRSKHFRCSKMMVSEKLQGAWDQPSKCIFIFAGATNNLQKAALQFSEKVSVGCVVLIDVQRQRNLLTFSPLCRRSYFCNTMRSFWSPRSATHSSSARGREATTTTTTRALVRHLRVLHVFSKGCTCRDRSHIEKFIACLLYVWCINVPPT